MQFLLQLLNPQSIAFALCRLLMPAFDLRSVSLLTDLPPRRNLFHEQAFATAVLGQVGSVQGRCFQYHRKLVFRGPILRVLSITWHRNSLHF
jgi:hypothetical protein